MSLWFGQSCIFLVSCFKSSPCSCAVRAGSSYTCVQIKFWINEKWRCFCKAEDFARLIEVKLILCFGLWLLWKRLLLYPLADSRIFCLSTKNRCFTGHFGCQFFWMTESSFFVTHLGLASCLELKDVFHACNAPKLNAQNNEAKHSKFVLAIQSFPVQKHLQNLYWKVKNWINQAEI